jgi:hypothetical protein
MKRIFKILKVLGLLMGVLVATGILTSAGGLAPLAKFAANDK